MEGGRKTKRSSERGREIEYERGWLLENKQ